MPFNRINTTKAISFWLLILASSGKEDRKDGGVLKPGKWWVPGMMVVPFPQAGWILGYIDIGYWAAFSYVLGSVFYVVDSLYLWPRVYPAFTDDPAAPGTYLNTASAAIFVVNALMCFIDWYLQRAQLSVMNLVVDDNLTGGFQLESINYQISLYYFFNNFFFLGAAVIFVMQGLWAENGSTDLEDCSSSLCGTFWINFWGNLLYLLSSSFSGLEYLADKKLRRQQGLPELSLWTTNWEMFDWFGWGDILYVVTSLFCFFQSFFMFTPMTDDVYNAYYLNTNVFFLFDSLAYFIGYVIYLYDLRRALFSGKVPIAQTAGISAMIGDCVEVSGVDHPDDGKDHSDEPRPSVFTHVENGYVTIDEIREKLHNAKIIRARRSMDAGITVTNPIARSSFFMPMGRNTESAATSQINSTGLATDQDIADEEHVRLLQQPLLHPVRSADYDREM